jgi:hypothetical protein
MLLAARRHELATAGLTVLCMAMMMCLQCSTSPKSAHSLLQLSASKHAALAPMTVSSRYYRMGHTWPTTPVPALKAQTDYAPGYPKEAPGDDDVYVKRLPSIWVNTGMARAPGTTLTQQSFALNLLQPRIERESRKLEMQFQAAQMGEGNLTSDDGSVLVSHPALALHAVMQRKRQMAWTVQHWNDDCFDYQPHYHHPGEDYLMKGEVLASPCAAMQQGEAAGGAAATGGKEAIANPATRLVSGPATKLDSGHTPPESRAEDDDAAEDADTDVEGADEERAQEEEEGSQEREKEEEETYLARAHSVLHKFRDVQIHGEEYVPVFVPSHHPEMATARIPRTNAWKGFRTRSRTHRAPLSRGRSPRGGWGGRLARVEVVQRSVARKMSGVQRFVAGVVRGRRREASMRGGTRVQAASMVHGEWGKVWVGERGRKSQMGKGEAVGSVGGVGVGEEVQVEGVGEGEGEGEGHDGDAKHAAKGHRGGTGADKVRRGVRSAGAGTRTGGGEEEEEEVEVARARARAKVIRVQSYARAHTSETRADAVRASGGVAGVALGKLAGRKEGGSAGEMPAMYPLGYHVGSVFHKYVEGYRRRMQAKALEFCHGQLVSEDEIKVCVARLLEPSDEAARGAALKRDEEVLLGHA